MSERVGAACGHHIGAGNGGGRETSVDPPAPVSDSVRRSPRLELGRKTSAQVRGTGFTWGTFELPAAGDQSAASCSGDFPEQPVC